MATSSTMFLSILILFVLCFSTSLGEGVGGIKCGNGEEKKTWCVAKASSSEEELGENINFACKYVDCRLIQQEGDCFYPNTTLNHASIVMNLYYQVNGRNFWNCDFKNSALITLTNPSYGCCKFV